MDQMSTYAALRNNVMLFMKRRGDQVRAADIINSPDIESMKLDKTQAHAFIGTLMTRLSREGEVVRIKSYDPRYPNAKYAYRLPNEGEVVQNEVDAPKPRNPYRKEQLEANAMSEALKKAGVRNPNPSGPVAKIWNYLNGNKENIQNGTLTRSQAGKDIKSLGINTNTISAQIGKWVAMHGIDFTDSRRKPPRKPRRSVQELKADIRNIFNSHAEPAAAVPEHVPQIPPKATGPATPKQLDIMIDRNGQGVTITLSGFSIHIGVARV